MTALTSKIAFSELNKEKAIPPQENKIFLYLKDKKEATRRQIARDLSMETSTVSARVNSLVNKRLIKSERTTKDPITNNLVYLLEVVA